jgi:hypothetical protein
LNAFDADAVEPNVIPVEPNPPNPNPAAVVPCCPKPFYKLNKIIFQSK